MDQSARLACGVGHSASVMKRRGIPMMITRTGGSSRAVVRGSCPPRRRRMAIGCELLEGRRLLSTLQQGVQQLRGRPEYHPSGSNVTIAEVKAVTSDFESIAAVATKPDPAAVTALKTDFRADVSHGKITPVELAALRQDVSGVLTSASIPNR